MINAHKQELVVFSQFPLMLTTSVHCHILNQNANANKKKFAERGSSKTTYLLGVLHLDLDSPCFHDKK
jgi:hypothetical protein